MPAEEEAEARQGALTSLKRMQEFDVESLPRDAELGGELNFREAVEPAKRLVALFGQVSVTSLEDLPLQDLGKIRQQADTDFNKLAEILTFTSQQANPHDARANMIRQLTEAYQPAFTTLLGYINYSASKAADFRRLEREARATLQSIKDEGTKLTEHLQTSKQEAEQVLADIRKVAAEQGVSQQAIYFADASERHTQQARHWIIWVLVTAALMAVYAVGTIFLHKVPWLKPSNAYESVQLAVSKVLVFAVLSYVLYLSARNFLAHSHNAILNKHRQNALMTYTALVDAAADTPNKEVILTHASFCIFAPQATGYSRQGGRGGATAPTVVELLTKPFISE